MTDTAVPPLIQPRVLESETGRQEAPAEVLLVDDEPNVLATLQAVLQLDGYVVATASSGAEALQVLSQHAFDVVISDLRLNDADGLHVLAQAQRFSPDTTTVVITGYGTLDAATEALRGGVSDFLLKPCDPDQLRLVVTRGVERRRLSQQIRTQLGVVEAAHAAVQSTIASANTTLDRRVTQATANLARRIAEIERLSHQAREAEKQIRLQAARLQALADASQAFAATRLDLPTLLKTVARRVSDLVGDGCLLFLLSDDEQRVEPVAMYHPNPDAQALADALLAAPPLLDGGGAGDGVAGEVWRTGASVLVAALPAQELIAGAAHAAGAAQTAGSTSGGQVSLPYLPYLQQFPVHSLLAVPFRVQGRVIGVLAMWQDVSDGSYTAADQVFLQDLADRAALAIENARLYDQLLAALETREFFLAAAAHDLKGPLTSLKGNTQLLLRQLAAGQGQGSAASSAASGAGQRAGGRGATSTVERLARIDQAADRMARMLDQLLDLTRQQTGQALHLDRYPMDLVTLARERVAEHEQSAREHPSEHHLRCTAKARTLVGEWDRARLERVLDNLLSNALKYSPDGGEVTVELAQEQRDGRRWAMLTVRDEGLGIPAADLPHIFERFRRGRNVAARIQGTGVGLTSAQQIVEAHGGAITVASEEGHGSTFIVRLPLDPAGGTGAGTA